MSRSQRPGPDDIHELAKKVDKARADVVAAVDREREAQRMRRALETIAEGREIDAGDGTTAVVDRDDAMEIARAALDGRALPGNGR